MFLLGENVIKLIDSSLYADKNGKYYITAKFSRKPASILGLKSKVTFATHIEYIFDYDRTHEICNAFGHELKTKPEDMEFNEYMTHLWRRVKSFKGKEVKVIVGYTKELRRDKYGIIAQRVVGFNETSDISDYRQELDFYTLDSKVKPDWYVIQHKFYSQK